MNIERFLLYLFLVSFLISGILGLIYLNLEADQYLVLGECYDQKGNEMLDVSCAVPSAEYEKIEAILVGMIFLPLAIVITLMIHSLMI